MTECLNTDVFWISVCWIPMFAATLFIRVEFGLGHISVICTKNIPIRPCEMGRMVLCTLFNSALIIKALICINAISINTYMARKKFIMNAMYQQFYNSKYTIGKCLIGKIYYKNLGVINVHAISIGRIELIKYLLFHNGFWLMLGILP